MSDSESMEATPPIPGAEDPPLEPLRFWQLKLQQLFHDPPGKPLAFKLPGGHKLAARLLLKDLIEQNRLPKTYSRPDRILAGADRAVLPEFRARLLPQISFVAPEDRILTHPLCAGPHLRAGGPDRLSAPERREILEAQHDAARELHTTAAEWNDPTLLRAAYFRIWRRFRDELITPEGYDGKSPLPGNLLWERMPADTRQPDHSIWDHNRTAAALAFVLLTSEIVASRDDFCGSGTRAKGARGPSDREEGESACRGRRGGGSASPANFAGAARVEETPLPPSNKTAAEWEQNPRYQVPDSRQPWLLVLSLGPVQDFISESRKAQDLWVSSMLLADLVMHTLAPILTHYGPDAVLYPDLQGNPHFDRWLLSQKDGQKDGQRAELSAWLADALPEDADPTTFAGILPNTAVAVVPRGHDRSQSHLKQLEVLARECEQAMHERWKKLADLVKEFLQNKTLFGTGDWTQIWDRQHTRGRLQVTWTALEWRAPEPVHQPLRSLGAFPAQNRTLLEKHFSDTKPDEPEGQEILEKRAHDVRTERLRAERLQSWMPESTWQHYQQAREVFSRAHLPFLQSERGFDYAPTHHQLHVRHRLRKHAGRKSILSGERGEKCTLCGLRSALVSSEASHTRGDSAVLAPSERRRETVRAFWKRVDPDGTGSERLCGICAFKRFLIDAGGDSSGINPLWAGNQGAGSIYRDGKARVPFPSTSTIAAQDFLERVCQDGFRSYLQDIVSTYSRTREPRTSFPDALPRLARLANRDPLYRQFLEIEPQLTLFPEAAERLRRDRGETGSSGVYEDFLQAVRALRKAAKGQELAPPSARVAIIRLDGDGVSRLLLGAPDVLKARWRDVLHPAIVEAMARAPDDPALASLGESGWPGLLDKNRLMGPALHAFLNRALAEFSHRIVPWVVEQEFDGRLIYAGGDDVLALAPADQALPLVARLQQLYSAAWIVDLDARPDAWPWRRRIWLQDENGTGDDAAPLATAPHLRFGVVAGRVGSEPDRPASGPLELPIPAEALQDAIVRLERRAGPLRPESAQGPVLPMLGPHHSLSASIVYAHHKTPLRGLLQHSKSLLDDVAKERAGRGSVALARYSRAGVKETFALPWQPRASAERDGGRAQVPAHCAAHLLIPRVVDAFQRGPIPGRMPYKLRSWLVRFEPLLQDLQKGSASDPKKRADLDHLLEGALREACEGQLPETTELDDNPITDPPTLQQLLYLWREGIRLFGSDLEASLDGLLLCRALAGGEEGDA